MSHERARVAKPGNGGGLKTRSRRGSWVQIPPLAVDGFYERTRKEDLNSIFVDDVDRGVGDTVETEVGGVGLGSVVAYHVAARVGHEVEAQAVFVAQGGERERRVDAHAEDLAPASWSSPIRSFSVTPRSCTGAPAREEREQGVRRRARPRVRPVVAVGLRRRERRCVAVPRSKFVAPNEAGTERRPGHRKSLYTPGPTYTYERGRGVRRGPHRPR